MISPSDLGPRLLVLVLSKAKVLLAAPTANSNHRDNSCMVVNCLPVPGFLSSHSNNKVAQACKACLVKELRVHSGSQVPKDSSSSHKARSQANSSLRVRHLLQTFKDREARMTSSRDRPGASKLIRCQTLNSDSSLAQDPCNLKILARSKSVLRPLSNDSSRDLDFCSS
ncbi:hypothetical protein Micbo1qcDRAFT_165446, partial [Microdochium bolleyi]